MIQLQNTKMNLMMVVDILSNAYIMMSHYIVLHNFMLVSFHSLFYDDIQLYHITLCTEEDMYWYIAFCPSLGGSNKSRLLWFEASRWTSRFASLKGSSIRSEAKPRVWLCSFKVKSPISACLGVEACCLNSGFVKFRDFNWQNAKSTKNSGPPGEIWNIQQDAIVL